MALARELEPGVPAESQHVAQLMDDQSRRRDHRAASEAADPGSAIRTSAHRPSNRPAA